MCPFSCEGFGHLEEGAFGDVIGDLGLREVDFVGGDGGGEDYRAACTLNEHLSR